jgi:hypothetical protein
MEKEKEFPIPIWQWAETQLEAEPGPTSRSFSLPLSPFPRGPAEPAQPARPLQCAQPASDPLSTRYWPDIVFVPTEFTPYPISWWSSWFEAELEIRRTRLHVPYVLDQFPPINSSFPMRILPQLSRRLLARRHQQSILPRHLASIQRLEVGTRRGRSEPFPGPDHRRKPLAPPLQSTRTAFPSSSSINFAATSE